MTNIKDDDDTRKNEAECRLLPEKINGNGIVEFINPAHGKYTSNGVTACECEVEEDGLECGLGPCVPHWMQMFANKKAFLVTFCITWVLQGMYYTYFVSVITTIEKLYRLQSKTTGIIMSATEIGQIGSSLLLTYYGGQGHRPRWIACGMVVFALSSLLCAIPHFIYGAQPLGEQNFIIQNGTNEILPNLCHVPEWEKSYLGISDDQCNDQVQQQVQSKITTTVLAIFFISLLGVGMGQTAVYTLGIPYIDDNVANRESPLYFAITIGVRILGPSLGFVLGSFCTRLYVDISETPDINPSDPRWVGAWWLGLVLVSVMLMCASVAMFMFPKKLTSAPAANGTIAVVTKKEETKKQKNPSLKDFPKAVKRLLRNDILMYRTASSVLHILPIAGLYTFLPKYFESQFKMPAHAANMVSGVGGIMVMGVGIIISGVFILKFKPNARFVAAWIALTAVLYALGMGILMFIGCEMDDFAGLKVMDGVATFEPVCNTSLVETCGCDPQKFSPICGGDGWTYFSECHAGCKKKENGTFSECSCMLGHHLNGSLVSSQLSTTGTVGYCKTEKDCGSSFKWYIILFSFFVFIHSTSEVGSMLLILRCVDPKDKAMALGLIQFAIGLFGNVPCPIVYGAVVDSACLVWDTVCGKKGACNLYDTNSFRKFYHGTTGSILLCAFLVDTIVWYKAGSINFEEEQAPSADDDEMEAITEKLKPETCV
uniref:Solute carrier organic anion transporter family member n=1 Tax=Cacopsylla melanoneura TaxID=428564 RepID=A0A8D8YD86_9HEMI